VVSLLDYEEVGGDSNHVRFDLSATLHP